MAPPTLLSFALVSLGVALGVAAAFRRLPRGAGRVLAVAGAVGLLPLWVGLIQLRDIVVFWQAPFPAGADAWILFALAFAAGAFTAAWGFAPAWLARLGLFVVAAAFASGIAWFYVGDDVARAWNPLMPLCYALVGVLLPRTLALAVARQAPTLAGAGAGVILGLVALQSLAGLVLMLAWGGGGGASHVEWVVTVHPSGPGPYELEIPFFAANATETADLLSRLRADAHAEGADATLRPMPDGRGFVLSASGPATVRASHEFLAGREGVVQRFDPSRAAPTPVPWTYDGEGHAMVSWWLGPGCGTQQQHGSLVLGDRPEGMPVTTTPPSGVRPCFHGD